MTLSRTFFVSLLLLSPALFTVACGGDDGGAATPAAGSGGAAGAGTAGAAGTSGEAGAGGQNAGAGGAGAAGAGGAGGAAGENTAGAAGAGAAGSGAAGGAGDAGGAGVAGGAGASGSAGAAGAAGADPLAVCEGIADLCVGYTNVFAWEGKETLVPEDMDTIDEVTALVAQGDKLVAYPGVKSPLGRIVFAGVPVGPYQLQFKRAGVNGARPYFRLIASSDRKLNLGRYYVGRPFADAMPKPALARLQAPFVTAWRSPVDALGDDTDAGIDQLYLYSYAAQYEGDIGVPKGGEEGTKAPVYGDASLDWTVNMASFPPSYYPHQRIDASKGDTTVVLQTYSERLFPAETDAAPDAAWQAGAKTTVAASYSSSTFTMTPGQTAALSGTFAIPPTTANATWGVDFQASAFAAEWEATTVAPVELRSGSVALSVYAEPGIERVTGSPAPTLLYVTASSQLVPLDPNCYQAAPVGFCESPECTPCDPVLCGGECNDTKKRLLPGDWKTDFVFANPLANPSTLLGDVGVYYGLPGGAHATYRSASLTISDTIANLTGKPLVPVLGFVHDLAIDGQAASWQEDERLLSATGSEVVEVKWQKPALGTARRYYVGVYAAVTGTTQAGDSVATGQLLAQVGTADTSAAFPRAALPTGVPMYLTVRARSADRDDEPGSPENNPAFGAASSTTVSAYFKL